jgi:hypothetical protein
MTRAETPAATVTVHVTGRVSAAAARMADWVPIGTPVTSDFGNHLIYRSPGPFFRFDAPQSTPG